MPKSRGFTLIELVIVIVVLGLLAVMVSEFIGTGVILYRDNAEQQLSIRLDVTLSNGQFLTAPGGTFSFLNGEMVSSVG